MVATVGREAGVIGQRQGERRPFTQRWVFYLVITGPAWMRALPAPFIDKTALETVFAWVSVALILVFTPLFVAQRRKSRRS